jgi:death-on-curing protein
VTRYLSVADLIRINERLVERWGGIAGVRDEGLLESALARPQSGYYQDLIEEAAALCESLLQNHPFLDGNKRAAIVATAVFLRWNGLKLQFADREMYDWLMNLYDTGTVRKDALETWLRAHAYSVGR